MNDSIIYNGITGQIVINAYVLNGFAFLLILMGWGAYRSGYTDKYGTFTRYNAIVWTIGWLCVRGLFRVFLF